MDLGESVENARDDRFLALSNERTKSLVHSRYMGLGDVDKVKNKERRFWIEEVECHIDTFLVGPTF